MSDNAEERVNFEFGREYGMQKPLESIIRKKQNNIWKWTMDVRRKIAVSWISKVWLPNGTGNPHQIFRSTNIFADLCLVFAWDERKMTEPRCENEGERWLFANFPKIMSFFNFSTHFHTDTQGHSAHINVHIHTFLLDCVNWKCWLSQFIYVHIALARFSDRH